MISIRVRDSVSFIFLLHFFVSDVCQKTKNYNQVNSALLA